MPVVAMNNPPGQRAHRKLGRGGGRSDGEFMAEVRAASLRDTRPLAGLSLWLLIAALLAAGWWANQAVLDVVTRGNGQVIPSSHAQIIQSLEGGILSELRVREGDVVDKGQVLLRIDDTRFEASFREGEARQQSLRAAIARLQAEAEGHAPVFPDDLPAALVASQKQLFRSRKRAVDEAIAANQRSLNLADEELAMTAPLVKDGIVSEVEVLRLRRQVNELQGKIRDRRNNFRADARSELTNKQAELSGVRQINTARADQVKRAVVRSPMRGTVKNIRLTTIGGVIQPGMRILEIVPLEDQLLIEARIKPRDVAFLRPGLPVTVKITAYDYSIYGGLDGRLEQISADTFTDERNPAVSFYKVRVRTRESHLKGKSGEPLPIIPGMTASVEVLTGHKSVLDYILKPILKTRNNALRER